MSQDRESDRKGGNDSHGSGVSILIRGLPEGARAEELRELYIEKGEILDVYIPLDYHSKRPKSFAFVKFANMDGANAAVDAKPPTMYRGSELNPEFAKEGRKARDEMQRRGGNRDGGRRGDGFRDNRSGDDRYGGRRDEYRVRDTGRDESRGRYDSRDDRYGGRRDDDRSRDAGRYDSRGRDEGRGRYDSRDDGRARYNSRDRDGGSSRDGRGEGSSKGGGRASRSRSRERYGDR